VGFIKEHEGFVLQVLETHLVCLRERVIGRENEQQLFVVQAFEVQVPTFGRKSEEPEIDFTVRASLQEAGGHFLVDFNLSLRMVSPECRQELRQQIGGDGGNGGDDDPPGLSVVRHDPSSVIGETDDLAGVLAEFLAGFRETDAASVAIEEASAELGFEATNLLADGGLCDAEIAGGL
jgi:hypothetical protein